MTQPRLRRRRSTIVITPLMWGLLAAFIAAAILTAFLTFIAVRAFFRSNSTPAEVLAANISAESGGEEIELAGAPDGPLQDGAGPTPQPWDGAGRVNILMMGLDYRDWEGGGPSRTDTMILFTLDPGAHTAGMLSIPRDLWVNIPGYDYGKINTAYYLGEAYDEPGRGPGLAILTVEQLLGVPINYYAQVDFYAFERLINELGGIEIEVPEEISVDPLGPGNTVTLQPGLQTLDGPVALAYARNRDTFGGDFDRSARQQQVILAIRDRVLSLEMLPTLITKAPAIYRDLASSIDTNLSLDEIVRLAWEASKVARENISMRAIGLDQVTMTMTPDGLDILQPDPDKIRMLRDEVFTSTGPIMPVATQTAGDPKELMEQESASVSVLNATPVAGLAAETTQYLQEQGINVSLTGNAQEPASTTVIIDYTGKPYTVQYLVEIMQIPSSNIFSRYDPNSEVDIAILLGGDWAENNPMP